MNISISPEDDFLLSAVLDLHNLCTSTEGFKSSSEEFYFEATPLTSKVCSKSLFGSALYHPARSGEKSRSRIDVERCVKLCHAHITDRGFQHSKIIFASAFTRKLTDADNKKELNIAVYFSNEKANMNTVFDFNMHLRLSSDKNVRAFYISLSLFQFPEFLSNVFIRSKRVRSFQLCGTLND